MENKAQPKKEWTKPELTVLVRNKPEEAVLTTCKVSGGDGPDAYNNGCGYLICSVDCANGGSS
ncbi:MAG: hypothetical protein HZC40_11270 [Chloroflexi bacterium]|nr:hypothetical protein [Chloroflexota bacterium]